MIIEKRDIQKTIAKKLNVKYLSSTDVKPQFPVNGIISKTFTQSFVNLICKAKNQTPKNVIFIIATGMLIHSLNFNFYSLANI